MPLYAGFDLGGTQLKYGLIDGKGNLVFKDKTDTPPTIGELMSLFSRIWEALKKKQKKKIRAVGFGFPGILSLKDQRIFQSPNYPELDHFDLKASLHRLIEIPFWIDNDANMAAYGEWACGAGKGAQSLILLTLGTGVGSGIILEGKLWHGKCGFAAEMGHIVVNPDGERCHCGVQGCLETESSAPKIVKNYNALTGTDTVSLSEEVYQRAKNGDPAAQESFRRAGYYLGIGLGIAINFLNPEKILLGGGVMKGGEFLLPHAIEEARRRSYRASFECCSIERATLGNEAGFIGAASWARAELAKLRL